ncbi:TPA: hypothetical protein ACTYN4_004598 [Enterobacter hormaechei]|uniref:hypothetical protein n=1 Tax=Enterobacter cloacae complex TaxID=354276 RepID=UPI0015D47C33|nr:hypothetical protein [Enterobacter hormaechei]
MNFEEAKQLLRGIERWPTPDMHQNHVTHLHPLPEGWKWFKMCDEWRVIAYLDSGEQLFWYSKVWANPVKLSPEAQDMISRLARGEPFK